MTVKLRIPTKLVQIMLTDLSRPHDFAHERVGFVYCRQSMYPSGSLVLPYKYEPIGDDQYIEDETVGARFNSSSIRAAMQVALTERASTFHVHLHGHSGTPRFSAIDNREMQALIPCFVNVCPDRVHGALVLSLDSATGKAWSVDWQDARPLSRITFVGTRMKFIR